jgi:hypothetical protein
MKQSVIIIIFFTRSIFVDAQTLGGNSVFNFLRHSNTPQLTALGGENISNQSQDIGMAFHNPSLLRESMHTQANFVFNAMYGDIKNYHMQLGYHSATLETNFALGIQYFNYGSLNETDASGNMLGIFRPVDYVVQASMSRAYETRWTYGATIKFINSNYGAYRSTGLAADLALSYLDSANGLQASVVIKNIGAQLRTYTGGSREELPFDLQLGISRKLANAPIQFSFTANRLHRFDVTYNDSVFNTENGITQPGKKFTLDNLFRHIILAAQLYITDKVELSIGYNYLRRRELTTGTAGNGINGFSAGVGVLFKKLQFRYARAYYQANHSYHQLGLNVQLNELTGLGKFGKKIDW